MGLPQPPRPASESREDDTTEEERKRSVERHRPDRSYRGDFYYQRSYAERFPRSIAGSSTDQMGDKRKYRMINEPVSPGSIKKAARRLEEESPHVLQKLFEFQKLFEWKGSERY